MALLLRRSGRSAPCRSVARWSLSATPRHAFSSKGDDGGGGGGGGDAPVLVFAGKRAMPLRVLKLASIVNCSVSCLAAPVLITIDIPMPMAARVSMAATLAFFGLSTTGFLAWLSSPYVLAMRWARGKDEVAIDTVSLIGTVKTTRVPSAALFRATHPVHPFVTFSAAESTDFFYLDKIGSTKDREVLLELLGGPVPEDPEEEDDPFGDDEEGDEEGGAESAAEVRERWLKSAKKAVAAKTNQS